MRLAPPLRLLALAAATFCLGAAPPTSDCRINPTLVIPWRDFHRLKQPPAPFAREYRGCGKRLIYIAAVHGDGPNGPTAQAVRAAFARGPVDFVIVEGFPERLGDSPPSLTDYARQVEGAPEDAEPYLAIRLARQAGAGFAGGEPADTEVLSAVTAHGMSASDLFGFYVLRQIEQWVREGRIASPHDPALETQIPPFARAFELQAGLPPAAVSTVTTLTGWKAWYRAVSRAPFERGFRYQDAYPSGPATSRATNRMSDLVSDVREQHIVAAIARALAAHDNVLVVYGASHELVEASALEAAFGPPAATYPAAAPVAGPSSRPRSGRPR